MKKTKIIAMLLGVIIAIVFSYYSVSRIRAVNNPLSVYSFKQISAGKNEFERSRVKVSSYNIAHGRGGKSGAKNRSHKTKKELFEHLDKIANQIKIESPDIMVLNEDSENIKAIDCNGEGFWYMPDQKNSKEVYYDGEIKDGWFGGISYDNSVLCNDTYAAIGGGGKGKCRFH